MNRNIITCILTTVLLPTLVAHAAANCEATNSLGGQAIGQATGQPAAMKQTGQVMVDFRIFQINEPLIEMSFSGTQMSVEHQPDAVRLHASNSERTDAKESDESTITIYAGQAEKPRKSSIMVINVTKEATMKLGKKDLRLVKGRFFEDIDEAASDSNSGAWEVLSAPRILADIGDTAGITIGTTIPYMVQRDDGSLVVEYTDGINEGIVVELLIDEANADIVSFKDLSVEVNRIAGRQEIPGVPFDVGRPTVQSMKIATAMALGTDNLAIIHLPRVTDENPPLFIFLTTHYVD